MNQAQRNFLIKKIEDQVKVSIDALNGQKPDYPNISNFLLHAVMSNNFELKSLNHLKEAVRQKALKATSSVDWLTGERPDGWNSLNQKSIKIPLSEFFDLSEEYQLKIAEYKLSADNINDQIRTLRIQADTLITRIQLASDKVLDKMINEVDDMGDISLMDTKIKFLNS